MKTEIETDSMGMDEATKKAKKYRVPGPGQYVRFPRVEIYLAFLKMNGLVHQGFEGDMAIAAHSKPSVQDDEPELVEEAV